MVRITTYTRQAKIIHLRVHCPFYLRAALPSLFLVAVARISTSGDVHEVKAGRVCNAQTGCAVKEPAEKDSGRACLHSLHLNASYTFLHGLAGGWSWAHQAVRKGTAQASHERKATQAL